MRMASGDCRVDVLQAVNLPCIVRRGSSQLSSVVGLLSRARKLASFD
jgi:hypothetical protein